MLSGSAARCRLMLDPPASGGWNMGVDEMLLETATEHSPLVLRFYGWSPATLSLGYFQQQAERAVHQASLICAVTRRLSGGGAILHDRELTYSIVVPPGHPWATDIQALYDLFHLTLIETLQTWGLRAELCEPAESAPDGGAAPAEENAAEQSSEPFLCFQRRTRGDVLLAGWKVGGSAQRRRRGAVLQHGSVLWERSRFAPELPGLLDLYSGVKPLEKQEFSAAWTERIRTRFGLKLEPSELSAAEQTQARQLADEKYDCASWWGRR